MDKNKVYNFLNDMKIEYKIYSHPPVYTCEEADKYYADMKGVQAKNLFMKERKGRNFYLITVAANKRFDVKGFEEKVGEKIKFANEENLKEILGLTPGSVSPFGLINDIEKKVKYFIDKDVISSDYVNFHPNVNDETLEIEKNDFVEYLNNISKNWNIINL